MESEINHIFFSLEVTKNPILKNFFEICYVPLPASYLHKNILYNGFYV